MNPRRILQLLGTLLAAVVAVAPGGDAFVSWVYQRLGRPRPPKQ